MNPLIRTTAALLASARLCLPFNLLFAAFALWHNQNSGILLCAWLIWLHIRIDIDRRIFNAWAQDINTPQDFDHALQTLGLPAKGERPLPKRCRGALRLYYQLLFATLLQILLALIA